MVTVFILFVFMSGEHTVAVEFTDQARCEAARVAINKTYSGYIPPRTICVPK